MTRLGIKECEVRVQEFESDIIALIEFNRQRQKTASDILRESEILQKEYKSRIGQGKRTDLGGGKNKERSDLLSAKSVGVSLTQLKQLKSINNYAPALIQQINKGEISINKAYHQVRQEFILPKKMGLDSKSTYTEFKRRLQKLFKEFEPSYEDVMYLIKKHFPEELSVSSDSKLEYEKKKNEIVEHLEFLKKMNVEQYLLYKKYEEVEALRKRYSQKDIDKVQKKLYKQKDFDFISTAEEIEKIEPILKVVESEDEQKEFTILRTCISAGGYDINPGRHIKIFVMDKPTKTYLGVIVLSSDFHTLQARDEFIGWTHDNKFKEGKLRNTAIVSSIVPIQPLGFNLLGGKLIASLSVIDQIRKIWKDRYGDELVGLTTTSLYGSYSMYNSIPYWKKLGSSKGTALIKPNDVIYKYWLRFIEKNYNEEFKKAQEMSAPKQKILKLMYDVLGIQTSKLQNEYNRGIYFSSFYKNTKEHLCNEIADDELIIEPSFVNMKSDVMEWWKKKAMNRYKNLIKHNNVQENHLWYGNITKEEIQNYLNSTKLFEFMDIEVKPLKAQKIKS